MQTFVDGQQTPRVRRETRVRESELGGIPGASRSEEHDLRTQLLAAREHRHDGVRVARVDRRDLFAETQHDAPVAEVEFQITDDFRIEERQNLPTSVHDGDLHVERIEDRRVFDADHTSTDDRHRSRQPLDAKQVVTVHDSVSIHGHPVGTVRLRPRSDENLVGIVVDHLARRHRDSYLIRAEERGTAVHQTNAVAVQLIADDLDLVPGRVLESLSQVVDRNVALQSVPLTVERTLSPAGQVEHGLAKRLARDRARMNRHTADHRALFDDHGLLAELGSLNRRFLACGAASDHEKIDAMHGEASRAGLGLSSPSASSRWALEEGAADDPCGQF